MHTTVRLGIHQNLKVFASFFIEKKSIQDKNVNYKIYQYTGLYVTGSCG